MDVASTRSRLRRTFAYPTDDDGSSNSSSALALDETEQEDVIASLATQNHATNSQFRLFLLALPTVSAVPYLLALANPAAQHTSRTTASLALTSLASTAWLLWSQLPGVTGIDALDRWATGRPGAMDTLHGDHGHHVSTRRRDRRQSFSLTAAVPLAETRSPLAIWLPYLNLALCGLLVLAGLVSSSRGGGGSWGHVSLANMPGVVYLVVLLAKVVMGGVDPEKELSGLKYEFKGA
ncbi:hypothetical protein PFICI_08617 [Pestalotiopsis fici W106-1]|uniref:Uncharacterized protein n=1 Tax=Pestalotiopsis fici (strain W106-1 / CGMCC3.15140) TaxID=1229662 RepID=W3WYC1_PESFW|nr:uncharacterized protein PFICI_08617 [Pestalotiopsis fici W106-1]ETS78764.1 hypothetical protein PFICI_08617 [Pestalotiopsis fici W106-1]